MKIVFADDAHGPLVVDYHQMADPEAAHVQKGVKGEGVGCDTADGGAHDGFGRRAQVTAFGDDLAAQVRIGENAHRQANLVLDDDGTDAADFHQSGRLLNVGPRGTAQRRGGHQLPNPLAGEKQVELDLVVAGEQVELFVR